MPKAAPPSVIVELTDDLVAQNPRSMIAARVTLGVLLVALIGTLALVWDTRREVTSLSTELRAREAPPQVARTIALTFNCASSIEYVSPADGVFTSKAEPGQLLQPGDLVAEIMDARDHWRLVKARAKHRRLLRDARRRPAFEADADRARDDALRLLTRARRSYVRAAQRGIAGVVPDEHVVKAGQVIMRLDDPATLSADLPAVEGIDRDTTCRLAGEGASEECRLVFERTAEAERVRIVLSNEAGRLIPGQIIELTMERRPST
jgi:hypothetical protein